MREQTIWLFVEQPIDITGQIIIHSCNVLGMIAYVVCVIGPGTFIKRMGKR